MHDPDQPIPEAGAAPSVEPGAPLSDAPLSDNALLDLLDALVTARGRVAAARVLAVNYRTLARCCDTRRVSPRMRQALVEFRDAGGVGSGQPDGVGEQDDQMAVRVAELEAENAGLREQVAERERELEQLRRRVDELQSAESGVEEAGRVDVDHEPGDVQRQDWRPPRRRPGLPEAGVVTLEQQPDEAHAFGPAAALVAEWRQLRAGVGQVVGRVERAHAAVRRWELEAELLGEHGLTLPPDTYPLDDARRAEQVRWRQEALAEARRELRRARRVRWLRRFLTLGLWRN